jgi:hypothetical protein
MLWAMCKFYIAPPMDFSLVRVKLYATINAWSIGIKPKTSNFGTKLEELSFCQSNCKNQLI